MAETQENPFLRCAHQPNRSQSPTSNELPTHLWNFTPRVLLIGGIIVSSTETSSPTDRWRIGDNADPSLGLALDDNGALVIAIATAIRIGHGHIAGHLDWGWSYDGRRRGYGRRSTADGGIGILASSWFSRGRHRLMALAKRNVYDQLSLLDRWFYG